MATYPIKLLKIYWCTDYEFINIYSSFKEKDVYEFNLSILHEQFPYRNNRIENLIKYLL